MDSAAQKAPLKDTRNDTENSCRRQLQILPRIYVCHICHILHSLWPLDPSAHGPEKGRERFTSSFFSRYAGYEEEESGCTAFDERPEFD